METSTKPNIFQRYFPILGWLPHYERSWLRLDLMAGLTVVALLIPEGMAYAQIAGMPPQTAFYAAPIGLLAFAIFGTSRQLVVAVSAIIATMSFATVSLIAVPGTPEFILLTAALAVLAGLISILAGFLKLGRVAQFFSESVMVGFITGLALIVMVKQVPKILGIEGGHGNFWERLYEIIIHLPETHLATLVTGLVCLVLLIVLEHYFHKIPAALVALVFGILFSVVFGLEGRGVEVVGDIPAGLAPPQWPAVGWQNWWLLFPGALGLALVNFAEAIGPARSFAASHKYKMEPNQELIGLGAANFGAGLFQGFPIGSNLSKSAANDRAGARSQMSGIIAAAVTVLVALFFTPLFYALPEAALGAIVIVAVSGMVKVAKFKHLYHVRRKDFILAVVALLALINVIFHISRPHDALLDDVDAAGGTVYRGVADKETVLTEPGLIVYRFDAPLVFANANFFSERLEELVANAGTGLKCVILDAEAISDFDSTAAEALENLDADLERRGIELWIARANGPLRELLGLTGLTARIGEDHIYPSVRAAVTAYQERFGTE